MKNTLLRGLILGLAVAVSGSVNAGLIGIWGKKFDVWDTLLTNAGHTAVAVDSSSTPLDLSGLDQIWLIRANGNKNLVDYVFNGGTLITEWNASTWAVTENAMLDATIRKYAYRKKDTTVTFTPEGQALGLGGSLGASYSNNGATEYFEEFKNIGANVDVIATFNNGRVAGISGAYGSGNVISLGWDWQDVNARDSKAQLFVNDVAGLSSKSNQPPKTFAIANAQVTSPSAITTNQVPEPSIISLFALGLLGVASRRIKSRFDSKQNGFEFIQ